MEPHPFHTVAEWWKSFKWCTSKGATWQPREKQNEGYVRSILQATISPDDSPPKGKRRKKRMEITCKYCISWTGHIRHFETKHLLYTELSLASSSLALNQRQQGHLLDCIKLLDKAIESHMLAYGYRLSNIPLLPNVR